MRQLNYAQLNRYLQRAEEVALEPTMNSTVKNVYDVALKPKADAYRAAFDAIAQAESKSKKEGSEADLAVKALEMHYKAARSTVLAIKPTTVLPKTLSAQATDTDILYAIETLVDVIDDHVGEKWADDLLNGEFGAASAKAVKELSEAIAANKDLSKATAERAAAFGPAHEAFNAYKRVVRDALGAKSKQYRRLHMRATAGGSEEDAEEGTAADPPQAEVAPGPAEGTGAPAAAPEDAKKKPA